MMKKNVYNTFCTKIDHQCLMKDSIIDQQESYCFGTLREVLQFTQLDFCHHNLVCLSTVTHGLGKNYFDQCRGWVNKKITVFFASLWYQPQV